MPGGLEPSAPRDGSDPRTEASKPGWASNPRSASRPTLAFRAHRILPRPPPLVKSQNNFGGAKRIAYGFVRPHERIVARRCIGVKRRRLSDFGALVGEITKLDSPRPYLHFTPLSPQARCAKLPQQTTAARGGHARGVASIGRAGRGVLECGDREIALSGRGRAPTGRSSQGLENVGEKRCHTLW